MGSSKPLAVRSSRAAGLQPVRFTTAGLPAQEQFEAWRHFMSPAIELQSMDDASGGFLAEQTIWNLGRFALSRAVMPADGPVRVWRHLRRNPLDHWCLVLVRDAEGESVRLFVRSLGREFVGHASDHEVICLYIPRSDDSRRSERLDALPSDLGQSTLLDMLADFIVSLEARLPEVTLDDVPNIAQAMEVMIEACLVPGRSARPEGGTTFALSMVERARQIIRREIYSPDLTPDSLARAMGVSRSGLYRLFEPLGGVRHAIQRDRLHAAHRVLSDPERHEPILDIAEQAGFGDASGFSRAFRKEFSCSPSEVRAAAALGAAVAAVDVSPPEATDLGRVLSRLHS